MTPAIWTQIGVVAAAIVAVIGAGRNLQIQHRLAAQREQPQTAIDGFDRLTKHMEDQIRDLYSQVEGLRVEVERYRKDAIAWRKQLRLAVSYVKQLLAALSAADVAFPKPPEGLDLQA